MKSHLIQHILTCIRKTPLAVFALVAYVSIPSSLIYPEDYFVITRTIPWFVSYFNTLDVVLFVSLLLTSALLRLSPTRQGTGFLLLGFASIMTSLFFSPNLQSGAVFDALIHFCRFAFVFSFASGLTRSLGPRQSESFYLMIYAILCASAVVVYHLTFETMMGRIYASGMGVGSFAQVSVVACIIAIVRRQYVVLAVSSVFLVLTFSVTSTVMFILVVSCIPLIASRDGVSSDSAQQSLRHLRQVFVVGALVAGIAVGASSMLGDVGYNLKFEDAAEGHGRKVIWMFALQLLRSGHVGVCGLGFFRTTGCFQDNQLLGQYADHSVDNQHFHSIIFEGALGLGVLCLPLFWMLFRRIWVTYWTKQYLPCAIFLFFLLTQSVDFTIYRPKELIVWAFILGIADGQFIEAAKKVSERRKVGSTMNMNSQRRFAMPVLNGAGRNG
ncbi:MAG: hypothetical protein AABP62_00240 [Planctomycetota bacterium]